MSNILRTASLQEWERLQAQAHRESFPVLLPGALGALIGEAWTPGYFSSMYPDIPVMAAVDLSAEGVPYEASGESHMRNMTMAEFMGRLASGSRCYLSQFPVQRVPGLVRQLRPSALHLESIKAINLWIGSATRSGLHFDFADNLFGQAYGNKRFLLIAPKFSRFLYQFPDVPSKSQVDPDNVDRQRFPNFQRCEVIEVILSPGDLLFIPKGWWHFVVAGDISISVNCWHGGSLSSFQLGRLYLAGGLQVPLRWIRDFVWHGLLGHAYKRRLFSPASLGVESFDRFWRSLTGKDPGRRRMVAR